MIVKSVLGTAIAASLVAASGVPAEECQFPNFDELASSLHNKFCAIESATLERDVALLAEHRKQAARLDAMDPDSAAETMADIKAFIASIDKDGDGLIDGFAAAIEAIESLTPRTAELERRAGLTDEAIALLGKQNQTNAEGVAVNAAEIKALKEREDKEGVSEERVHQIAAEITCRTVNAIKTEVDAFNTKIQAIDCGALGHAAFMSAVENGEDFTPPEGDGGGEAAAVETSDGAEADADASTSGAAGSFS